MKQERGQNGAVGNALVFDAEGPSSIPTGGSITFQIDIPSPENEKYDDNIMTNKKKS